MHIAQTVSRGESVCRIDLPGWAVVDELDAGTMVHWLRELQQDFHMIQLALADEEMQTSGEQEWEEIAERMAAGARKLAQRNTRQTKEDPHPPTWLGAAFGASIETPSAGLSLGRVASPQSPPRFHPTRRAYPEAVRPSKPDCRPDREK